MNEDQLDLDLTQGSNIRVFTPKKGPKSQEEDEPTAQELMDSGLEVFLEMLSKNPKGFVSVVFGADNYPEIVWAGNIELIPVLGSLEMAKNELYSQAIVELA
jgi:hypothetical protein